MDNMAPATSQAEPDWPELRQVRRAIVVVDVVESVRLMLTDEAGVIDRWRRFVNEVRTQVLPLLGGRLVKSLGDGMLLEFESVPSAVAAALTIQRTIKPYNGAVAAGAAIHLRVGAHVAEVVVDELDVYGVGVNVAARIAALAAPGHIVVSADVRDELVPSLDAELGDMGDCFLKHVAVPVRCFQLMEPERPLAMLPPQDADLLLGPTIAVMPFQERSGGQHPALGAAIAEELTATLSRCSRLQLISSLSTRALVQRELTCSEVGARLGARFVVSGTVSVSMDRANISVELSDAVSSYVVWSDLVRVSLPSLLQPADEGLASIVAGVMDAVDRAELERARSLPLPTLRSYTLMVGGVTLMHRTGSADFARAREILNYLVDRTGRHPVPLAWLAKWHVLNVQQGWSVDPKADAHAALEHTRRAIDADASCSLAHTIEGFARANVLREFDAADACYSRALDANPNDSLAWLLSGVLHAFKGDGEAAVSACERAQRLSPLDPLRYFYDALSASAALTAGRYDRAVVLARRSLQLNRSHLSTHRALTAALMLDGRADEARLSAHEMLARDPGFTVSGFLARTPGQAFGVSRRIADALREAGVPA